MVITKATSVEVRLPSVLGFEKVAMGTAASAARLMGFSDDRVEDLKTAIAEACINAIEHGNRFNENLRVSVTLTLTDDALEVRVADKGPGMSRPVPPPDIDRKMHGDDPARGLGMFLIQSLVDEAEWVTGAPEGGSYVRLVIRLKKDK
jgi:serine/threonine-protein kinase RsbW